MDERLLNKIAAQFGPLRIAEQNALSPSGWSTVSTINNPEFGQQIAVPGPSISLENHILQTEEFIGWLESNGIDASKTRLPKYIKFLNEYVERLNSGEFDPKECYEDHKLHDRMLYTLREVHELLWIYNGFKIKAPKGYDEKLKKILGGNAFAKDDTRTIARDHQLELRIASYFLRANHCVDISRTTDIVTTFKKQRFFIECKRLNSPNKADTRITDAAKQINRELEGKRRYGIVVFDVTKLAFPHQGLTWGFTNEQCQSTIQLKLRQIENSYDFCEPFLKKENVLLIWLQIHIPSFCILTAQPTTRFSSMFLPLSPQVDTHYRAFKNIRKVIENNDGL